MRHFGGERSNKSVLIIATKKYTCGHPVAGTTDVEAESKKNLVKYSNK